MSEVRQKIPARLESAVKGGYVTGAKDIVDDALGKAQDVINEEVTEDVSDLKEAVGTGGSVDERINTEKTRAQGVEQGLNTRLSVVEQLAEISVEGGEIGIATAADFESDDSSDLAKVPTVGAILGGANDGVYDISARNNRTKYADLAAALGTNGDNVPVGVRRGGMSIKFVQSSDSKYVQYRLMSDTFNTTVSNWQGVDDNIVAGSDNLAKSGDVAKSLTPFINLNNDLAIRPNTILVPCGFLKECYVERAGNNEYCLYSAYVENGVYNVKITKTTGNYIGSYSSNEKESFIIISLNTGDKIYLILDWDALVNPNNEVFYYRNGYLSALAYNLNYSPSIKAYFLGGSITNISQRVTVAEDNIDNINNRIDKSLSQSEIIDESSLTLLGSAYMNIVGDATVTAMTIYSGYSTLYYYPVEAGKTYLVSSELSWSARYAAVGFSETIPAINGTFDSAIVVSDTPISNLKFIPGNNGYLIISYRENKGDVWKSYISQVSYIDVEDLKNDIKELKGISQVSEIVLESSLTLLGSAYLNVSAVEPSMKIMPGYGTVYYYPVEAGKTYKLSSELQWYYKYAAVGFSVSLPVIGNTFDKALIAANVPTEKQVFIPESNGYILLVYRNNWKSYIYTQNTKTAAEFQEEINTIQKEIISKVKKSSLRKRIICSGSSITWGGGGLSVLDSSMVKYVDTYIKNVLSKSILANSDKISYSEATDVLNNCMFGSTGKMISGVGATIEFDFDGDEIAICQMKRRTGTDYGVMKVTADDVEIGVFDNKNAVKHTEETFSGESLSEVRLANPCTFNHQIYINGSETALDNVVINASNSTSAHIPDGCNAWVFRAPKGDGSETCHGIQFAESLGTITSVKVAYDYGRVIAHERSTIGQTDDEYTNESYYGNTDVSYDPDQPNTGVGGGLEFRAIDKRAFFIHKFTESKNRHFKIEIVGGTNPYFILNYVTNRYHDMMNAGIGGWELKDLLYREDKLNHWTQFFKYWHPDVLFEEAMTNDDWDYSVRRISRSIGEVTLAELQQMHQLEVHKITYNSNTDKYAVEMCTGIISAITPTSLISTDIIGTDTEVGDIIRIGNYHSDMHQITCRKITEVNLTTGEVKWVEPLIADDILMIDDLSDLVGAEINIRSFINGARNYKQYYQDLIDKVHSVSANTKIVIVHNGLPNLWTRQLWGYEIIHAELCKENVNVEFINAQEHIYDTMFNTITGTRKETVVSTGASSYDLSFAGTQYGGWQGFKVLVNGVDVYGKDAYIEMDMAYRMNTNVSGAAANKTNPYDRSKSGWNRTGAALTLHFIKNIPTSNDTIEVQYADTIWSNDFCHVTDFGAKVYGESYSDIINILT